MKRAVIAGGSIAGLLAARVLRDRADEVVVVEPDQLPAGPVNRPGTAHGEQFHVLLGLAQELLTHWFPDLLDDLVAAGTVVCTPGQDGRMFVDGRQRPVVPGDVLVPFYRPLLEWHIREAVLPSVRLVSDRVVGLVGGSRVHGVRLASGSVVDGADLVVDATGRGSRLGAWLAELGFPAPPRQRIGLDLGYATALFHRSPDERLDGLLAVHSLRSPTSARPGVSCIAPVRGDRWMCTISGYGDDRPTRDPDEFTARCLLEPADAFAALARTGTPAGPVTTHRFPHSIRRDFHTMPTFPTGLVPIGDAVASFNPIYGQGVPSAALHASALAAWLDTTDPTTAYFRRLKVIVDTAWQTSATEDLRLPHVTATRPLTYPLQRAISTALDHAAMTDPLVAQRFAEVINMRIRPTDMLTPTVLGRTLLANLRKP
ncbi:FAD-dependent oxidoreductase [Actinokineospora globicatena]|uniref:FAD-dependent oxidoreductase n=1 Tax=Actinokineospora globicatena TaxID=103729 RepID=UPI0024A3E702|nr:hypothetical protein [Actinokineospora globicatena]MCP2302267.1 Dehydrogenase (flavoprotein) [Actinokineospora globicatena]GLW76067.1 FAD-binding monooxygenase [Actinokineospora globicatena]GLW82902.1 FAD-binding monooxygenase [Actinokineospora globicatena]